MPGYRRTPPATDTADPGPAGLPEGSGAAGLCRPFPEVIAPERSHRTPPEVHGPVPGLLPARGLRENGVPGEKKREKTRLFPNALLTARAARGFPSWRRAGGRGEARRCVAAHLRPSRAAPPGLFLLLLLLFVPVPDRGRRPRRGPSEAKRGGAGAAAARAASRAPRAATAASAPAAAAAAALGGSAAIDVSAGRT